jgi:hypothetical protein
MLAENEIGPNDEGIGIRRCLCLTYLFFVTKTVNVLEPLEHVRCGCLWEVEAFAARRMLQSWPSGSSSRGSTDDLSSSPEQARSMSPRRIFPTIFAIQVACMVNSLSRLDSTRIFQRKNHIKIPERRPVRA